VHHSLHEADTGALRSLVPLVGQGAGHKAPSGHGAWCSTVTSITIQPRRKLLTKRRRVARGWRRGHASAAASSRCVAAGLPALLRPQGGQPSRTWRRTRQPAARPRAATTVPRG